MWAVWRRKFSTASSVPVSRTWMYTYRATGSTRTTMPPGMRLRVLTASARVKSDFRRIGARSTAGRGGAVGRTDNQATVKEERTR